MVLPTDLCPDVLQAELHQMVEQLDLRLVFDRWMGYKHGTDCV